MRPTISTRPFGHWLATVCCVALFALASRAHNQQTFPSLTAADRDHGPYLDAPIHDGRFTTLDHPAFPQHTVRIKKAEVCEERASAYTGYIDVGTRHLFFYFFESRNSPTDDIVFWTNGGPGGSSSIGLFMEMGPCLVNDAGVPEFNPYSWTSNSSMIFVDQPVGTGFSYADFGQYVSTSEEAAADIAAFLGIFFAHFSQYQGLPFHMTGESYAGHNVPIFASAIWDQNAKLRASGISPINLQSIMIGNGLTNTPIQLASVYDVVCTDVVYPPVTDVSTCMRMKQVLPRCERWSEAACVTNFDHVDCQAALTYCATNLFLPYFDPGYPYSDAGPSIPGKNPYDLSKSCEEGGGGPSCYAKIGAIARFLSAPETQDMLGVDPAASGNFTAHSNTVQNQFYRAGDQFHSSQDYVAALLHRGIRVMMYAGTYDLTCTVVGIERWMLAMEWTGHSGFVAAPLRPWLVDGRIVGQTRTHGRLTFASVDGAGHLVPYDKPKEALELFNRWIQDVSL